jgi:hypothetical protein
MKPSLLIVLLFCFPLLIIVLVIRTLESPSELLTPVGRPPCASELMTGSAPVMTLDDS